jgi:hypothetical protein
MPEMAPFASLRVTAGPYPRSSTVHVVSKPPRVL